MCVFKSLSVLNKLVNLLIKQQEETNILIRGLNISMQGVTGRRRSRLPWASPKEKDICTLGQVQMGRKHSVYSLCESPKHGRSTAQIRECRKPGSLFTECEEEKMQTQPAKLPPELDRVGLCKLG